MPENSQKNPDRKSQTLRSIIKKSVRRITSTIGQARLQLDSGSEGNPKNSTLGKQRRIYEHTALLCVWKVNTPLHCFFFPTGKRQELSMPFLMDNKQITVMIFVKCCIATFHYPLPFEWCSQWWASIKISGMPYGFVNI